jgi:hypothetical protein
MAPEEHESRLVGHVSLSTWVNGEVTITVRNARGALVVRQTAAGPSVTMQDHHGYQKANFHFTDEGKLQGTFDEMNPDKTGLIHVFSYPPRMKPKPVEPPTAKKKRRKKV